MARKKDEEPSGMTIEAEPATMEVTEQPKMYSEEEIQQIKGQALIDAREEYKGFQRVVAEREIRIKELEDDLASRTLPRTNQRLVDELERQYKDTGDEEGQRRLVALRHEIAQEEERQRTAAQFKAQEKIVATEKEKVIQSIKETGEDPNAEKFDSLWDSFDYAARYTGQFDRIHERLAKKLGSKKPEPIETDVEKEERIRRQVLEKEGLLTPSKAKPSGGGMSDDEFERQFGSGLLETTPANFKRAKDIIDKRLKGG